MRLPPLEEWQAFFDELMRQRDVLPSIVRERQRPSGSQPNDCRLPTMSDAVRIRLDGIDSGP